MRIREKGSSRNFLWLILELIIIFAGVFLAIVFNNLQEHKRDIEKARSIFEYFLNECEAERGFIEKEKVAFDSVTNVFLHAYKIGDMPDITGVPVFFTSSVNTRVWEAILISRGTDVLDFATIRMIDTYENSKMGLFKLFEKGEIYSMEFLLPNMEKTKFEYYNYRTKELRPKYSWFIKFLLSIQQQYTDLLNANIELSTYLTEKMSESK